MDLVSAAVAACAIAPGSLATVWIGLSLVGIAAAVLLARAASASG